MPKITPFLMFEGRAEEAIDFYVATIPGARILDVQRYGEGGPAKPGSVMLARFEVGGLAVMCSDSFVKHAFTFTPSSSLFVDCSSEAELEGLFKALATDGSVLMPLDNYGFSRRFGWVNDRFGVSWQVNLP